MSGNTSFTVMMTSGEADDGKAATLGFSCALSSVAMGNETTVFLTGDGSIWAYQQSADDISLKGFPALKTLIEDFQENGGEIYVCSVCYKTLCTSGAEDAPRSQLIEGVKIGGFTVAIEKAQRGPIVTF